MLTLSLTRRRYFPIKILRFLQIVKLGNTEHQKFMFSCRQQFVICQGTFEMTLKNLHVM